ncbi:hypothetical protein [Candidatus Poriferisocius sp.]|uniref:hypothetical protein n=1 Tax=Candidatus Poriferisocius sp. TaxID=3101276 RepID=UPI003B5B9F7F
MSQAEREQPTISRQDILAKFEELRGGVDHTAASARSPILAGCATAVVLLVVLAFLLGRRRGRASRTLVEVRRV